MASLPELELSTSPVLVLNATAMLTCSARAACLCCTRYKTQARLHLNAILRYEDASGFSAALRKGNNRGHVILCPGQWCAAEKNC